jgi:signal transduction histidine kinase
MVVAEKLILGMALSPGKTMTEQPRVCIVDDSRVDRHMLTRLLQPAQYDLHFAESGEDLLTRIDDLNPDVILLDIVMPGIDGFEVCQRLKDNPQWQHVPIILVSALDGRRDMIRGLDAGADEFLSKPVNGLELRARIRSMLRIKKQYDELQTALRVREDLANMIVHDMRSPLSTMLFGSELLLRRNGLKPEDANIIKTIRTQTHRLDSFVNDLLMVAKMQQGQLQLNQTHVDINELASEAVVNHEAMAQSKGINLVVDLPKESPIVFLDANLFSRVLDNLISNALKFSPAESTVLLQVTYSEARNGATPDGPSLLIRVLDEGPGIPEYQREAIFEKFKVTDVKQNGVSQIGLGLAFCKMVVETHGGHIYVTENEPAGSAFTVEI